MSFVANEVVTSLSTHAVLQLRVPGQAAIGTTQRGL